MRKVVWIFSAPLVAGSLAWAVTHADDRVADDTPAPRSSSGQKAEAGSVHYFSRSGKAGEVSTSKKTRQARKPTPLFEEVGDAAPQTARKYVRNRPAEPAAPTSKEVRNFYHELFDEPAASKAVAGEPAAAPGAELAIEQKVADAENAVVPVSAEQPASTKPSIAELLAASEEKAPAEKTQVEKGPATTSSDKKLAADKQPAAKSPVVSAQYEHSDENATNRVQQVQGAARRRSSLPYLADEAGAKKAQGPAAKKTVKTAPAVKPVATVAADVEKADAPKSSKVQKASHSSASAQPGTGRAIPVEEDLQEAVTPAPARAEAASIITDSQTPNMTLRWDARGEVNVGQECKCALVVKNNGKVDARDVIVEAYFPRNVRLLSAEPHPVDSQDHLSWTFEHFAAGEEKVIEIAMVPSKRGEVATSATVRFTSTASAVLKVQEPQLTVSVKGPQQVTVGEAATQIVTVSNPGNGVATDVTVLATVPDGLEHARGKQISIAIGSLSPGETREIRLALNAIAGGDQILLVEAKGGLNLVQQAESQIKVTAPKLDVAMSGPSLRYINRPAQYTVTIANNGAAATDNVRVIQEIPDGFEFIKADHGGKHDRVQKTVTWFVGRLEAGQTRQVELELTAKQMGTYVQQVRVGAENGVMAEAKVETRVDGTTALVMEIVDLDDPVEVKSETAYEIRIRNDGTQAAANLVIACALPQGVELISTEGPTDNYRDKGLLLFKPLAELGPRKSITYRVKVAGTVPGNLRFRARLSSDSSPEPLIVEELTKFYAD